MTYTLYFTEESKKDLAGLKKNEPVAFNKAKALLRELQKHPKTGTGKSKPLGYGYKELQKSIGLFIPLVTIKFRC